MHVSPKLCYWKHLMTLFLRQISHFWEYAGSLRTACCSNITTINSYCTLSHFYTGIHLSDLFRAVQKVLWLSIWSHGNSPTCQASTCGISQELHSVDVWPQLNSCETHTHVCYNTAAKSRITRVVGEIPGERWVHLCAVLDAVRL